MATPEPEAADALAMAAWDRGHAALARGDLAEADRWLDRARRIAPRDDAVALSCAVLRLRLGRPREAVALLDALVARIDNREAWLALAAARLEAADAPGAAAALGQVLSRHVLPADIAGIAALAARIAAATGAPGWCGLRADGRVHLAPRGTARRDADGRWHAALRGRTLLGSPIDAPAMRSLEGVVAAEDGSLTGWAWMPRDPDTDPLLSVCGADGRKAFTLRAADAGMDAAAPLTRPRRFRIVAGRLAGLRAPVSVRGPNGAHLPGSPLDPGGAVRGAARVAQAVARRHPVRGAAEAGALELVGIPAGIAGPPAAAPPCPDRKVVVVVPVHRGLEITLDCLDRVAATVPPGTEVIVVDDATPEPALAAALRRRAREGAIRLLRLDENVGFPAAANAGLRAAFARPGRPDAVLLNSDTRPAPGWLACLRAAVHAAGDIGTATPLSNDATILSYPDPMRANPAPDGAALARMARDAARAAGGTVADIPTAVGFCMYIRRECLAATGLFRDDVFAQGYGEENDFCLRARHLGWRHVAVPGAYVAHLSGRSFGAATAPLLARNLAILEQLHPGYGAAIAAFQAADPLAASRRRLDALRWRALRRREGAVLYVSHLHGGGVERVLRRRAAAEERAGRRAIVLRPALGPGPDDARPADVVAVHHGAAHDGVGDFPSLRYRLPGELGALAALLRADGVARIEVHHMLGHHHALPGLAAALGAPVEWHVHDYASFCPRISLLGPDRRYCGEPDNPAVCDACVADAGAALEEEIGAAALRARSAADFAAAGRVVVPSADAASRLRRHFPALRPVVEHLEHDAPPPPRALPGPGAPRRVAVIGAIGTEKGYDVLLACAREAQWRGMPISFVVVGHSSDDARLLRTGRVFVTGRYDEAEAASLIRAQGADLAFLPSVWPETWCFTLGVAWRAGLHAAVFDIGAQAERVRATGGGWVLPLGLSAFAINTALLAVRGGSGDV